MGLLDGLIGGVAGGALASVMKDVLDKHGGLQGMLAEAQNKGLGEAMKSWIGMGPNQAISAEQVSQLLGGDMLNQLAAKTGLPIDDLKEKLAQFLPEAIDKMTPNGKVEG